MAIMMIAMIMTVMTMMLIIYHDNKNVFRGGGRVTLDQHSSQRALCDRSAWGISLPAHVDTRHHHLFYPRHHQHITVPMITTATTYISPSPSSQPPQPSPSPSSPPSWWSKQPPACPPPAPARTSPLLRISLLSKQVLQIQLLEYQTDMQKCRFDIV